MRLALASFTHRGAALGERLADSLATDGHQAQHTRLGAEGLSLARWTEQNFPAVDGLIFVGAVGIAVRAVAPHLRGKAVDPAVVAVDETARFCVPLVSGHIGGANGLAALLASYTGATAVVTTATDLHGLFAVDSWAVGQGLSIQNPQKIKTVSAKLLKGETIDLHSAFPIHGPPPLLVTVNATETPDVVVSLTAPTSPALWLLPPAVTVGIGCRKGIPKEAIAGALAAVLEQAGIPLAAVCQLCSIERKAEEPGLVAFCREAGLPFVTFSAARLLEEAGSFTPSPFVESVTGVDNVCERAAVAGSGGRLLVSKTAGNGITIAIAQGAVPLTFDGYNQTREDCPE